ncbi:MAG: prolipoprotein diacylglyceryl transferase [Clostridia bacterium]
MLPMFEVFGLQIPMFGIMMMCGMLAAFILLWYTKRYIRFTEDQVLTAALWAIILGFLGAKILFWIVEIDQIIASPHYMLETLRTGFVFYGSLIGGVLGLLIYSRLKKLPFFAFFDLLCPSLVLAQAFGRIGCFFAGCCYGSPSDAWCAVTYPIGSAAPSGIGLLPTQLFESAFLFMLTVVLVQIMKRKKTFGTVTGWYLLLYGVWRFIIEFFRSDDRGAIGALSTSQFIGIFIIFAGITILLLIKLRVLRTDTLPVETIQKADKEEAELFDEPEDLKKHSAGQQNGETEKSKKPPDNIPKV